MTKGRNTSVISLRLPDDVITRLKAKARTKRQTLSDYLKTDVESLARAHNEVLDGKVVAFPMRGIIKVLPNQPCPCGAKHPDGKPKKYKHCCGSQSS